MEKEKKSKSIVIVILIVIILGLSAFIVWDKVLKTNDTKQINNNAEKTTN